MLVICTKVDIERFANWPVKCRCVQLFTKQNWIFGKISFERLDKRMVFMPNPLERPSWSVGNFLDLILA